METKLCELINVFISSKQFFDSFYVWQCSWILWNYFFLHYFLYSLYLSSISLLCINLLTVLLKFFTALKTLALLFQTLRHRVKVLKAIFERWYWFRIFTVYGELEILDFVSQVKALLLELLKALLAKFRGCRNVGMKSYIQPFTVKIKKINNILEKD